jgi:hypothetical protein
LAEADQEERHEKDDYRHRLKAGVGIVVDAESMPPPDLSCAPCEGKKEGGTGVDPM